LECGEIGCIYIFRPDVQTKYGLPIFDVTLSTARKIFQVFLAKSWAAEKWSTRAPSQNT
jgi:hypothetical protein